MSVRTQEKRKPSRLWIWAVIVGFAVILGGFGLVYLLGMPDKDHIRETPSSSEPIAPTNEPDGDKCDAPGGDITDVPTDLEWEATAGVTWPVSSSLGPTSTQDGWSVCFSQSPVGASLAAVTSLFATVTHSPEDVSKFYIAESTGKLTAVAKAGDVTGIAQQLEQYGMQLVGFRVDEFSDDRALVRLVFSSTNSQTGLVGLPYPMIWVNGDWRLKVLDDGSTGQAVPVNEGQFTRWSDG